MLSWLASIPSFFFAEKAKLVRKDKLPDPESIFVHVWDVSSRGVGHASIQVGGDKPTSKEKLPGRYMSLWPNTFPVFGFFSLVPGPAATALSLEEDMRLEALSAHADPLIVDSSSDAPLALNKKMFELTAIPPTRIIEINGLDTKAILAEINKQSGLIKEGQTTYQLFPQWTPLDNLLIDGPAMISQDPIDAYIHFSRKKSAEAVLPRRYNCTMFVRHLLGAGGMDIPSKPWSPWGLTPNQLGDYIENNGEFDVKISSPD